MDRTRASQARRARGIAPAARARRCWRCWPGRTAASSAQEIHDALRAGGGKAVGLASVYRALDVLAQLKLVHRIDVDGVACYEPADPSGDHHHHAICDRCGKLDAFEDAEIERLLHDVGERLGYEVGAHDVVLRGACPDCAAR